VEVLVFAFAIPILALALSELGLKAALVVIIYCCYLSFTILPILASKDVSILALLAIRMANNGHEPSRIPGEWQRSHAFGECPASDRSETSI